MLETICKTGSWLIIQNIEKINQDFIISHYYNEIVTEIIKNDFEVMSKNVDTCSEF